MLATVLGAALAVRVCHRRHDLDRVLVMAGVPFFLRVVFETELNRYYLWPVPALRLLLSVRRTPLRFGLCTAALVVSMVLGNRRVHDIVLWWPALMATLVVMLASVGPSPRRLAALAVSRRDGHDPAVPVECEAMVPVGAGLRRE